MALSASTRGSNRIKPTPLERPGTEPSLEPPDILSQRILLVMILPQLANSRSRSGCVMCLGRPDTYRLAPLIASLLGRANDTFIVLFCNLNPLRVWIALEASSCL